MRLSFSSNAFRSHSLPETIGILAPLGYEGIEIMADTPHAYPPRLSTGEIAEIRDALGRHGMEVANVNAFTLHAEGDTYNPSWIDRDPAKRGRRIEHTRRCIELAAALGAKSVSTEPGGPLPVSDRAQALELFRQGLAEVEECAKEAGVMVLIEPEPGLLIEKSRQFLDFYSTLDPEVYGLNFDIGHFFCVGEDPAQLVREMKGATRHFHLEDIDASRRHFHLIPGEGVIPFGEVVAAIEEIGYDGFVTVELYTYEDRPAEAAEKALRFLQGLAPAKRPLAEEREWPRL